MTPPVALTRSSARLSHASTCNRATSSLVGRRARLQGGELLTWAYLTTLYQRAGPALTRVPVPTERHWRHSLEKTRMFERARDELFSHINRCGVLEAEESEQKKWMDETIHYISERYPTLVDTDLRTLYQIGTRFCAPPIVHGELGQA